MAHPPSTPFPPGPRKCKKRFGGARDCARDGARGSVARDAARDAVMMFSARGVVPNRDPP